jgi:hypothetical protein
MTIKATQPAIPALLELERRYPSIPLCLAGTVVVMNVCATVLSLMV